SSTPADVDRMVKVIKQAREKVGPDGAVMFDAHCALPPATLIQFAAAVQPYDLLFLEEPAVPGNIEVFKRIKESVRVPLAPAPRPGPRGATGPSTGFPPPAPRPASPSPTPIAATPAASRR